MSMATLQGLCARILLRSSGAARCGGGCHALISERFQSSTATGTLDPVSLPRLQNPAGDIAPFFRGSCIWSDFMQLMAVPKRKVSPSRKGKRNGPKALKPVPVVAKCKVCGRIKLPHFYCCSGQGNSPQQI